MRLSLSEVISKASDFSKKIDKINCLKENDSIPLRQVLRLTYDDSIEFLIPNVAPPWKKNAYIGVEGMLYKEARRLRIFVKGGGYDQLEQMKRESLFISLLEDIDNADAGLLCQMITKKPFKGLTKKTLEEAFPDIYRTRIV